VADVEREYFSYYRTRTSYVQRDDVRFVLVTRSTRLVEFFHMETTVSN